MEPKIIKTKDYIEFIGHYDDIAKCAKLSALASLYAIDSKVGYAKFPIEYEKDIYKALNCSNIFTWSGMSSNTYNGVYIYPKISNDNDYIGYYKITLTGNIQNAFVSSPSSSGSSSPSVVLMSSTYFDDIKYYGAYNSYHISSDLNSYGVANTQNLFSTKTINLFNEGSSTHYYQNQKYGSGKNILFYFKFSSSYSNVNTCFVTNGGVLYAKLKSGQNISSALNTLSKYFTLTYELLQPTSQPLTKDYTVVEFYNNNQLFNKIQINGESTDDITFNSIDSIKYINTSASSNVTVYSNSSWTTGYNSTLDYITTAPNVTTINSDCNSIVTFTTRQVETAGNSISIGTLSLSASYIGTSEVNKIYSGTSLVYEKQASGFSVSGTNDTGYTDRAVYSTDNGTTWNNIPTGSFTLPAMTTFKLKIGGYADYLMSATSTQLGLNLPLTENNQQISNNYTLTQNITDLIIHGEWD